MWLGRLRYAGIAVISYTPGGGWKAVLPGAWDRKPRIYILSSQHIPVGFTLWLAEDDGTETIKRGSRSPVEYVKFFFWGDALYTVSGRRGSSWR